MPAAHRETKGHNGTNGHTDHHGKSSETTTGETLTLHHNMEASHTPVPEPQPVLSQPAPTAAGSKTPIVALSPAERIAFLEDIQARATALLADAERMPLLTTEQRVHSTGKWKQQGDSVANGVLLAMEVAPAIFVQKKNGVTTSPDTAGARADLTCRTISLAINQAITAVNLRSADSALFFGARVREVTGPSYDLAVEVAARNEDVAQHMTTPVDVNAKPARTRKNNQRAAARDAKKSVTPAPAPKTEAATESKAAPADAPQADPAPASTESAAK